MTRNLIEAQPRDEHGRVPLTSRQRWVAHTIRRMTEEAGYPPTIRELMHECGFATPNSVKVHLEPMRRKGWVTWEENKARTLQVVGE